MDYFLQCLGRSKSRDNEREPLLPRRNNVQGPDLNGSPPVTEASERSVVDKFVGALAALEAGKVPSQDQISRLLQVLLRSELLKEDRGRVVPGNGPTSKQGRKVLRDVKDLIQALLQFGMEKNEDDKLQELYFQIVQVDSPSPVQVNLEASSTYRAGQTTLDAMKEEELKDHAPMTEQLAFDAATFLHALRTLCEMCIFSPLFRLILIDLLSIARDLVTHAAADVDRAAFCVQQAVGSSKYDDDIITTAEPKMDVTSDDVKDKGKEVAGKVTEVAQEVKHEWQVLGGDAADKAKERILQRIQEVVSRFQKHKATRSAIRAILVLMRKYTEKISSASETTSEVFSDALKQTTDSFNVVDDMHTSNYPPNPYGTLKHEEKKPFINITCDAALSNFKDMLQRLAGGHSLDGLLSAFDRVVRDLDEVPLVLVDEVNKTIEEKLTPFDNTESRSAPPSPVVLSTPASPSDDKEGKIKKHKRRKKKKAAGAKESPLSPLSPSESHIEESPGNVKHIEDAEKSSITTKASNPMRTYFSRVGKYLDKALDEPGWAISRNAAKTLEVLFDDGVELVNVVGESVIEAGVEIVDSNPEEPASSKPKDSRGDVEARRKFKNDLESLWVESEAYIAAFEKDKTTMRLFQDLDALGGDLSAILSLGGSQSRRGIAESVKHVRGWTSWVGWAIPRIMRMLPVEAIPIPSIEFKTGNMEGALQAIFVQSHVHGQTPTVSANPIVNSLVPDKVVLKEWTEVRIDMADYERPLDGLVGAAPAATSHQGNGVRTTSRLHMHLDGVRAMVEGVGYYFKYTGAFGFEYEDEGMLSVDVGMGSLHDGLGADIEIEIESDSIPFENASPVFEVPRIIVEEERDDEDERPPNLEQNLDVHDNNISNSPSASAPGAAQPLFRVVDVCITLHGLRFRLDKSRHWILNKLFIQPLAGPIVARVVREALEDRVRTSMEVLASGFGKVIRDANRRRDERRVRSLRENRDKRYPPEQKEEFGGESFAEIVGNWWGAVLTKGPAIFGRSAEAREGGGNSDHEVEVETQTSAEATAKGVIFTNTTTTTTKNATDDTTAVVYDKPTGSMQVVDFAMEASGTPLLPPPQQNVEQEETVMAIGGGAQLFPGKAGPYGESNGDEERLGGSGKGVGSGICDGAKKVANEVVGGIQGNESAVESAEERRQLRTQKGNGPRGSRGEGTWRSDAFDFK